MSRNNLVIMREQAQREANTSGCMLSIVHDPIANAEEAGDYGYCPPDAVSLLFRYGKVVETVRPKP